MGLGDASAGLGLHHQDLLPKSLSTHEALFFSRYRRGISEAHFCAFWRQALPACRRCWVLALQNAVNTAQNCCAERWAVVLSVLLLLWLARVLRGPCFFPVGFRAFWRARARPRPQNAAIYGVLLHLRFGAGLRAVLFGLLFLGSLARARARPHVSLLGWGPAGAQKAGIPGIIWSWNRPYHSTGYVSHTKTWYNFKEA